MWHYSGTVSPADSSDRRRTPEKHCLHIFRCQKSSTVERDGSDRDISLPDCVNIGSLVRVINKRPVYPVIRAPAWIEALFNAGHKEFTRKPGDLIPPPDNRRYVYIDDICIA